VLGVSREVAGIPTVFRFFRRPVPFHPEGVPWCWLLRGLSLCLRAPALVLSCRKGRGRINGTGREDNFLIFNEPVVWWSFWCGVRPVRGARFLGGLVRFVCLAPLPVFCCAAVSGCAEEPGELPSRGGGTGGPLVRRPTARVSCPQPPQ